MGPAIATRLSSKLDPDHMPGSLVLELAGADEPEVEVRRIWRRERQKRVDTLCESSIG